MSLRSFIAKAQEAGYLVTIAKEVDPYLEMARVINGLRLASGTGKATFNACRVLH